MFNPASCNHAIAHLLRALGWFQPSTLIALNGPITGSIAQTYSSLSISLSNPEVIVNINDSNAAIVGYDAHEALANVTYLVVVVEELNVGFYFCFGVFGSRQRGDIRGRAEEREVGDGEESKFLYNRKGSFKQWRNGGISLSILELPIHFLLLFFRFFNLCLQGCDFCFKGSLILY